MTQEQQTILFLVMLVNRQQAEIKILQNILVGYVNDEY